LVELDSRELRVTDTGRVFVRAIAQVFDAFEPAAVAAKAV
jgi:coproporphyrinogen III oxidase-like Fe-S oxidoreductase